MEKLLLTVRKAPDVLSVSQSRVYELLYAEQLDSVNSFGAAFGGQSVGVMNSRRPQGEGPDGLPGFVWTDEPHDPTSFTLILLLAVAERQRWRTQYDQGQNRGRCCGQCFGKRDRPTYSGDCPRLGLTR